jgi:hypothetical protein
MVDDEIEKRLAQYREDMKARIEWMQFENDLGIYDAPLHIRVWLAERSARMSTKH